MTPRFSIDFNEYLIAEQKQVRVALAKEQFGIASANRSAA